MTQRFRSAFYAATAKKYNIKNLPSLVFFRNKDPLIYSGDLNDEDEVLAWLTDEETLEIPGKIEEVNIKMLEKILSENEHIVVFFCKQQNDRIVLVNFIVLLRNIIIFLFLRPLADHDDDKKAQKIIAELENIDDECEEKDIDFVKTSDDDIDKEYDLESLPALVFYRNKFRTIYTGDLMKEDDILEWVLQQYNTKPEIIESVDRKTLQVLVNEVEHLAVLFCRCSRGTVANGGGNYRSKKSLNVPLQTMMIARRARRFWRSWKPSTMTPTSIIFSSLRLMMKSWPTRSVSSRSRPWYTTKLVSRLCTMVRAVQCSPLAGTPRLPY